ncbi:MAG: glucosidase [Chlamydiales bacterium]
MEEFKRLEENKEKKAYWKKWGPYLSHRQWGTVREDYSKDGDAWNFFPFDEAQKRCYRWGEDGIGGISDNHQRLCFSFAFWNGKDQILKERLFGLSNPQGNHGEDLKEYYFYLDNTPTHSYMHFLYKYPQAAFPYEDLIRVNGERSQEEREYELIDTGVFEKDRYFDIFLRYGKEGDEDIAIELEVCNRGDEQAEIHLYPTLFFRNTWSFRDGGAKPKIVRKGNCLVATHETLGEYSLTFPEGGKALFAENEMGKKEFKEGNEGTRAAVEYVFSIPGKSSQKLQLRFAKEESDLKKIDAILAKRKEEADRFYEEIIPDCLDDEHKKIQREALAGMLWNKQFYHYVVEEWLKGDPVIAPVSEERKKGRNFDWPHLYNDDILSVPDKWEYPAFFSWDSSFHALPLALVDPEFAKRQLMLLVREWYMNPNGQLPAYEWNFNDVNPPVHAWATWRVYKIEKKQTGKGDLQFLESVFQKLLLNFTWWINRKDLGGKNIFQGGFLGLDNISIFNRSEQLPPGTVLYQSDATSWMGMYCLNMLTIALELARENPTYEDMASKFYEHFLYIADAINFTVGDTNPLWDEEDGFYYDVLIHPDGTCQHLKVRSLVGLMPLLAVTTLKPEVFEHATGFNKRMEWFISHRQDLCEKIACMKTEGEGGRRILSIVTPERLKRLLAIMLDEEEFLSPYGIRSLSKCHEKHPYSLKIDGHYYTVDYEPGASTGKLFGGNSNWRGPIWYPMNVLLIESLQKYHHYLGDDFKVEFPTGSGNLLNLWDVAAELSKRLISVFTRNEQGNRPVFANREKFQKDPHFDHIHFHEYFHGDTGRGLGASHQTGWTGLVAKLIQQLGQHTK